MNTKATQSVSSADAHFVSAPETAPDRIVIGQTPSEPLVVIRASSDLTAFENAKLLETYNSKPISKLNALLQAVPSIFMAKEAQGKKLMEVVINGDLVRAADGKGLRPFAMKGDKITEQARLFEADKLQDMINAAAVWQIASVVVAQKHLADISQKLNEIKNGISKISEFLENQRKMRIQGTYGYLKQVCNAIKEGELPYAIRTELESCERELLGIQCHLQSEYQLKVDKRVEHSEAVGTASLMLGIDEKKSELGKLAEDINLCIKTRIAAWYILSLFPGETRLMDARRKDIEESISSFLELRAKSKNAIFDEIDSMKAFWNKEGTLQARRKHLKMRWEKVDSALERETQDGMRQISHGESLLAERDLPSRFIIQIENGQLIEARQAV